MSDLLQHRVKVINEAGRIGNKLHKLLSEFFKPYVGHQVMKKDLSLLKLIDTQLRANPEIMEYMPHTPDVNVWRERGDLSWVVQVSMFVPSRGHHISEQLIVHVGVVSQLRLITLCDPPGFRDDYTAEEVVATREAYREAKAVLDRLGSELGKFKLTDY